MGHDTPMVCVYRGTGPTDAYLVRDWLVRNEVDAIVHGSALLGALGQVPMRDAWPSVWVSSAEKARAEAAIRVFRGPSLVHPDWACACGETNPASFGSCWSCGTDQI